VSSESAASPVDAIALGARLAQRRKDLGLPQDRLAEAVGISRVQLQNIERGWSDRAKQTPANPRLSTLVALCRALDGRLTIDITTPAGVTIEFLPLKIDTER
jgi:transcriptional regulator with XRE-family HTH domain